MNVFTQDHHSHNYEGSDETLSLMFQAEFNRKVQYDFTKLVFLGVVPGKEAYLMEIIDEASRLKGYEKHKTIKYRSEGCEKTCHLYVKYGRKRDAHDARDKFRQWDDLNAELVSDILISWYAYEKLCAPYGSVTKGILDFVGKVTFNDVLDVDIVTSLLQKFGNPRIQIDKGVVNVAFSSMAEGIAACIVYGKWRVKKDDPDPAFYYRVQLEGTDSFSALIQKSTQSSQVAEAYKLEYFTLPDHSSQSTSNDDDDAQHSALSYENASRGRNYMRTGRQFVRSRPSYNYRGGNHRQNRPKYQSSNVYMTSSSNDQFSYGGTYYQQAEFPYYGHS